MKRYKIKKFSEYMGVSIDTVKHYQTCGILKPIIDPENNYRYYTITHGERLIVSKKFRNLGFNITDTAEMISSKNGSEIRHMLQQREDEIKEELLRLQHNYESLKHLSTLCDLFNHKVDTFSKVMRPGYYFFRHTYNFTFIDEGYTPQHTKYLMEQLPNAVKMLIVPYKSLKSRTSSNFYHTLALKESLAIFIEDDVLETLEYIPEQPAILYIYSRLYSHEKFIAINDIYNMLVEKGYTLSQEDIIIENAIDHYENGLRYENYLIYFPLA